MELAISAAKPRLSELISAVQRGERVVITKRGAPAAELIACPKTSDQVRQEPADDFFTHLDAARERLGIKAMPPEEAREFAEALHDSALSRRVLGVDDE